MVRSILIAEDDTDEQFLLHLAFEEIGVADGVKIVGEWRRAFLSILILLLTPIYYLSALFWMLLCLAWEATRYLQS